MNEIKFRAWDNENKEMLKVQELDFEDTLYGGRLAIRTDQYNDYFDLEDMILMQYTGLKDKNGKEIYEGDIIRATKRTDLELNYHNFKVFMHNGCYMFGNYNAHEFFDKFNFKEVIGNIYENKDLLEKM